MELPENNDHPNEQAAGAPSAAERILQRLNSAEPLDQTFAAELRVLADKVRRGDARRMFNASLSVVRHLGLAPDETLVEKVRCHFGRKGYSEKIQNWTLTIVWKLPAGDPLLIVAQAWKELGFAVEDFLRNYDAKSSLTENTQKLDAAALRGLKSQDFAVSSPKGKAPMLQPTRPGVTMTPPRVNQRKTPTSMKQTFPQRYSGRFLEGGAPGLGKRA